MIGNWSACASKSLPKILKHATPGGTANGSRSNEALASIKLNDMENASQVSSNSAITALEEEERSLRERLIVLEEQKFMISEMIIAANKSRRLDDATTLTRSVQDLTIEIDQVQGQLSSLDFASAYIGILPNRWSIISQSWLIPYMHVDAYR